MRTLPAVLVPLLLLACDPDPVAPDTHPAPRLSATSAWSEEIFYHPPGDFYFYCEAVNDLFDEVGPVLLQHHTVVTANGSLVYLRQQSLDGFQLVGQTTGIWRPRTGQSIFSSVERVSTQNGSYHFTYNLPAYIVENEQSGAVIRWPLMISVTRNANGIVTVDHTWGPCDLVGQ